MIYAPINHEIIRNTTADREAIALQTKEFLSRGGSIKKIPTGLSGYDLKFTKGANGQPRYQDARLVSRFRFENLKAV
ncbi:hypothetical protein MO867_22485 [Microbulbifer sp. OS29]|uniref:Transcriptional regulator SutA RNAP-binding domain-containing protein n=1 Tax=Microbulbifer okhotskensis TaxID=2926617 RepID=A0A9X2J8P4_9GAMM|nr:hypothetical protein [Microbulbifer okhotskensis]MCO1337095.1 hypothetical protein [Microbulbifer okhotskensis]